MQMHRTEKPENSMLHQSFYRVCILLLLLLLSACGSNRSIPVPSAARPFDPSSPTYSVLVEPIPFLADLTNAQLTDLCELKMISTDRPGTVTFDPSTYSDYTACRGISRCFPIGPDTGTYQPMEFFGTGEKILPDMAPALLGARLSGALQSIGNVTVARAPSKSAKYLVRAQLTEYNSKIDDSSSGLSNFGIGPLMLLTAPFSNSSTTKSGFVRIDLKIVDASSGRVVRAFPASGAYENSYTSDTFLRGSRPEPKGFLRRIMDRALEGALNNAATKIYEELRNL
jgi:hypothetical protein